MARRKKAPPAPPNPNRYVVEGFDVERTPDPSSNCFRRIGTAPFVWNGIVTVDRYRVTVERIVEPREVLLARLDALYCATDNHHHWTALEGAAGHRFGVSLHSNDVRLARAMVALLTWLLGDRERPAGGA